MKKIKYLIIAVIAIVCLGACNEIDITTTNGGGNNSTTTTTTNKPTIPTTKETTQEFTIELGNGHYIAGVDFPGGTYTVTAVSGNGNVSSSNLFTGGINNMIGVDTSGGLYSNEFKNAKFPKDVTLSISGVKVKLHSTNASTEALKTRTEHPEKEITLTNGNYTAGVDFTAGIYTIKLVSGNGNVSSSNVLEGGINAIMGEATNFIYQQEYKNISLSKDVVLTISAPLGTLTIKIIPVTIN